MITRPRAKRHSLYFLSVFDARSDALLGQLSDISVEGVSILTETPLQCPCAYLLRILVPQSDKPDLRLEFEAESRWTSADSNTYTTGFRITFLTDEQRTRIEKLVNDFGYSKIGEIRVAQGPIGSGSRSVGLRQFLQTLFTR